MSAQTDRFVHDRLPPREQWPHYRFDLPELRLPDQLNLVEELLDKAAAKGWSDRPMLRSPTLTLTYAQARERVDRIACCEKTSAWSRATACCCAAATPSAWRLPGWPR